MKPRAAHRTPRLYVEGDYAPNVALGLTPEQQHYLSGVMRLKAGDAVRVFNGKDGEWQAKVQGQKPRQFALVLDDLKTAQETVPDLALAFALVKRSRTEFIIEKATELGVRALIPLITDFTQADRWKPDRARMISIEAAEQCGRTVLPTLAEPCGFPDWLSRMPDDRMLIYGDERRAEGATLADGMAALAPHDKATLLIGPEGGFSRAEHQALSAHPLAHAIGLGPRILRADTAAVSMITLWQERFGDWAPS
ncbi:MAG: 16S rRNA (uracil(1498)-N(3))-methyltransferase [Pseudomonadota bacterium]